MAGSIERLRHLRRHGGCFPVGPRTRFRLTGADALRYLNGQATSDLNRLKPGQARSTCLLTPKGRLCAYIQVWRDADALVLDTDASLQESLLTRIERYIISDDVTIEDISANATGFHVFGAAAEGLKGIVIERLGVPGRDVATAPAGVEIAEPDEIDILRIERGVPQWGAELTEQTLPHEALLDKTAVDFDKGCYVGQEVVSRIESLGHVNRSLRGFLADPLPATSKGPFTLHAADGSGAEAGVLTSVAHHFELAKSVALGYLNRQSDSADRLAVHDETSQKVGEVQKFEFPLLP